MNEESMTVDEGLQTLRDTALTEGRVWYVRSMDSTFTTLERHYCPTADELIQWMTGEASGAGQPLELDVVAYHDSGPVFRFAAGDDLQFRVIQAAQP